MLHVAILGRPNVGKSTLFNRIIGRRKALVSHKPGLTRDRNYHECAWKKKKFMLIDTGGLEDQNGDIGSHWISKNVEIAVLEADVSVFIVDGAEGLNPLDRDILLWLRKKKKNIIIAVNKVDSIAREEMVSDFYSLGISNIKTISALHGLGINDLLDEVVKFKGLKKRKKNQSKNEINISIVGSPNVGKSSILNKLIDETRVLVSDVPGTTRDSIDTHITFNKKRYCIIDTAGIRKNKKARDHFERISVAASQNSIKRSDICVLVIDATDPLKEQDLKIASTIFEYLRACIIVVNKWDLIEDKKKEIKKITNLIKDRFPFLSYSPIIFISALTGLRVKKVFNYIEEVFSEYTKNIPKESLKETFLKLYSNRVPNVSRKGRRFVIKKVRQTDLKPPTFLMKLNNVEYVDKNYIRYIKNRLRKEYGFIGSPIKILWE